MPAVDSTKLNLLGTNTSGTFAGYLPPEMSAPIFEEAAKQSVAMQLIPQVPLGPQGKTIPIFTGTPTAEWVAEAGAKPISTGSVGLKTMKSAKLAGIFVVSAEVVRADPGGFMANMRKKLGESFAVAFDNAFFHGGGSGTSASPFSQHLDQTTNSVELGTATTANGGVYRDLVSGLELLVNSGKKLKSFALDSAMEPKLLTAVDTTGRPVFVESTYDATAGPIRSGSLLGRPSRMSDGIRGTGTDLDTLGYGGDFSQAIWGVVGGITYDVTDQATLPIGASGAMVSLWQNNLIAVRAEAEYGYLINDVNAFVKYTENDGA
ncbi:hypothetical protein XF35_01805 [Streptomyces platensis subsp. clarensis]|uniref:phage major capsid protein n=1 Tax=Streptomyces nigrescens TaxID=1920 RepID=UPI0037F4FA12|nr:hypothetical protein [Streptomyces platensis subsp. clarensis]